MAERTKEVATPYAAMEAARHIFRLATGAEGNGSGGFPARRGQYARILVDSPVSSLNRGVAQLVARLLVRDQRGRRFKSGRPDSACSRSDKKTT